MFDEHERSALLVVVIMITLFLLFTHHINNMLP
jgi:hypothetical protein